MVKWPRIQCFAERHVEGGRRDANQIGRVFVLRFGLAMVGSVSAEISYQVEAATQKCEGSDVVVD